MKTPTAEEINPFPGDLDGECAVRHFLGKSIGQIAVEFRDHGMSYQEDLMFMGAVAFCFYFPAAVEYVESAESQGDCDVVSSLCAVIEFRLTHDGNLIHEAFSAILGFAEHVTAHYENYDLCPTIHGDLRPRLSAIRQKLNMFNRA